MYTSPRGKRSFERKGAKPFGKPSFGKPSFGKPFGKPELHAATCADCGVSTMVPFKPNGKKPVLCRDCFGKGDAGPKRFDDRPRQDFDRPRPSYGRPGVDLESQLREINAKLAAIMEALDV